MCFFRIELCPTIWGSGDDRVVHLTSPPLDYLNTQNPNAHQASCCDGGCVPLGPFSLGFWDNEKGRPRRYKWKHPCDPAPVDGKAPLLDWSVAEACDECLDCKDYIKKLKKGQELFLYWARLKDVPIDVRWRIEERNQTPASICQELSPREATVLDVNLYRQNPVVVYNQKSHRLRKVRDAIGYLVFGVE